MTQQNCPNLPPLVLPYPPSKESLCFSATQISNKSSQAPLQMASTSRGDLVSLPEFVVSPANCSINSRTDLATVSPKVTIFTENNKINKARLSIKENQRTVAAAVTLTSSQRDTLSQTHATYQYLNSQRQGRTVQGPDKKPEQKSRKVLRNGAISLRQPRYAKTVGRPPPRISARYTF